ncbi:MAG: methionine--tRNA ligase [Pseudomonadota bacterium]
MTNQSKRRILVTSALPYANGPIHLGHLMEYIQTDIWVRFQKSQDHECYYVCADDAHGTAIMIRAEREGITPEALIQKVQASHEQDFADFLIKFDHYHSTHSEENKRWAEKIFLSNQQQGFMFSESVSRLYDPSAKMFLADRYVTGSCPSCKAPNQYGDNCEVCGSTYSAERLIEPKSTLSGATPELRNSEQLFFDLPKAETFLKKWLDSGSLQPEVANKLREWFESGLKPWDISREAPYFGFTIPGYLDKYFYVWLDAPIGYIASFEALTKKNPTLKIEDFWQLTDDAASNNTELFHFIGKDIVSFHGLFWPALLQGAGLRLPTALCVHGFVTVNGEKMSKSRGTFIEARSYLNHLKNPEYLRYYFATKLSSRVEDLDLQFDDFVNRINSDLVGKYVNIASRCAKFIETYFDNTLANTLIHADIYQDCIDRGNSIQEAYNQREFGRAMREIMAIADITNRLIDDAKPWAEIKTGDKKAVHSICSLGIQLFRLLSIYLAPVLPATTQQVSTWLNCDLNWHNTKPLLNHKIQNFSPLMQRIDPEKIKAMTEQSTIKEIPAEKNKVKDSKVNNASKAHNEISTTNEITIEDLQKIDIRLGKIISAERVEGADKLLKLSVDIGDSHKQVFAGIAEAYSPEQLVGRMVPIVVNLKPRKMRFGTSEAMILAAGPGGDQLWLLHPDLESLHIPKAGMAVK